MKNGIDFVYEYSDLNLLHTRVNVLTGKYAGIVLEFGGSLLAQFSNKNTFTFDYILYEVPDQFYGPSLRKDSSFNEYLGYLLVHVINCKNTDPNEMRKHQEAASYNGVQNSNIIISDKWYVNKKRATKQPNTEYGVF